MSRSTRTTTGTAQAGAARSDGTDLGASPTTRSTTRVETGDEIGAIETIRRGVAHSPEMRKGVLGTLLLAVVATGGQVVVPIAVQQTLDRGINASGGIDIDFTVRFALLAALAVVVTGVATYLMTSRLFVAAETGLATLRIKAFRHVHDLPMGTQDSERRGGLVSRVTSDIDQISQFVVFGGILFVVSVGQILVATVVMAVYNWQLTLVVWLCFAPLFVSLRYFQRKLAAAYGVVRAQIAVMLAAIAEPVVGASVVRAYAIERRTQRRIDESVDRYRSAATNAQWYTAVTFSLGGISAGLANAGVIVIGVWLGFAGEITAGEVLAFAFLVTLFVGPVQMGTQILTDAQNAIAGWRRVIGLLDTRPELVDPGTDGQDVPDGGVDVTFDEVDFSYGAGPRVLHGISVQIPAGRRVAVVGETGSGKSTLAKLLTRLVDPAAGAVRLSGVDLREINGESLRRTVVLVPQEGFLFDDTILANLRYGAPGIDETAANLGAAQIGIDDWLEALPDGLHTRVGTARRIVVGGGERQLVALLRAHLADPHLLVLDEATSSVDPALEMRINAALERLLRGRTSVTIAHRLSSAEAADDVIVVDAGRIVEHGPHSALIGAQGHYARMYASWLAQRGVG